jgi:hypothetical protein
VKNKFILFNIAAYYPYGGWDDFHSAYDSLEDAKSFVEKDRLKLKSELADGYQIVDLSLLEIVDSGYFK